MGKLRHSTHRLSDIGKVGFLVWLRGWKPIPLCWLFEKYDWPIPKYLIGGGDSVPQYEGSRIADDGDPYDTQTFTWQADEDQDVADWVVGEDFCISVAWGPPPGRKTNSRELRLRWRNVTDGGSFADLGSSGELTYSADTSLVNDNALTEGESGLTASQSTYSAGIEREGANAYTYADIPVDGWGAAMWAIDTDNALGEKQYEFELYNVTETAQVAVCSAQITMAAGATTYYEGMAGSLPAQGGVVVRKVTAGRFQDGAFDGAGVVARKGTLSRFQEGDLDGAGLLSRIFKAPRATDGAFDMTGTVAGVSILTRAVAGVISAAGEVYRVFKPKRVVEGVGDYEGDVTRKTTQSRSTDGDLTADGDVTRGLTLSRTITGIQSFTGEVYRVLTAPRSLAGVLSFAGTVVASIQGGTLYQRFISGKM